MSSTFVADSTEDTDDSLIIIVNNDGTITVDPDTLQKLIHNQHGGAVSVVRIGKDDSVTEEEDNETSDDSHDGPEVNLTVEGFYPGSGDANNVIEENVDVADPFAQLDPEYMEKLESALQSEHAKEILGHKLGDNLTEMLDILEGNDEPLDTSKLDISEEPSEVKVEVHNDHSYTSMAAPVQHPIQHNPPAPSHSRPLTRGGRLRVRGSGRILTRGGLSSRPSVSVSQGSSPISNSQPAATVQAEKPVTRNVVVAQGGRLVAHRVVNAEGKTVQKRIIVSKVPGQTGVPRITGAAKTITPSGNNPVLLRPPAPVQKSLAVPSARLPPKNLVRNKCVVKKDGTIVSVESDKDKPQVQSNVSAAKLPVSNMPVIQLVKKKTSPNTVKKLVHKNNDNQNSAKKLVIVKKLSVQVPKKAEQTVNPTPKTPELEDQKKKKEKGKAATPVIPVVLGPELFSTPDIIRRVSMDKGMADEAHSLRNGNTEEEQKMEQKPMDILSPEESLLDSIHAEVAKDGTLKLAEQLLLDDLTNDTDLTSLQALDNDIESTLEKMEVGDIEVPDQIPIVPEKPQTPPTIVEQTKTPNVRKLPPIELPHTRSASKKAAAAVSPNSATPLKVQERGRSKSSEKGQKIPKAESPKKRASTDSRKSSTDKRQIIPKEIDSDYDDQLESDDESWNSEDDPDRLWCICKKPHNNRFMICCDSCEEWFHGKCVGITKALGQQMEQQGVEWSCPNCKQAKLNQLKAIRQEQALKPKQAGQQTISSLECHVCKKPAKASSNFCSEICIKKHSLMSLALLKKETEGLTLTTKVVVYEKKTGKLFSGEKAPTVQDLTIWLTRNPTFEVVKPSILPAEKFYNKAQTVQKQAVEKPVLKQAVLTTKVQQSGTKTIGFAHKGAVTLKQAPKEVPVRKLSIQSNQSPKTKVEEVEKAKPKPVTPKTLVVEKKKEPPKTIVVEKKKEKEPEPKKRKQDLKATTPTYSSNVSISISKQDDSKQPEDIRTTIKKTLQDLLSQRVKDSPEIVISDDEIRELVMLIEEALYDYFNGTNAKYKSKYRSLVFNIKDPKNLTLYKKILTKAISPEQLVKLTPEELASQELAQWREKEAKHQIEIIKKNEFDLIHQNKTVVLKSRKGEEVIESKNHEANITELESALNRTAEDYEIEEKEKKEGSGLILNIDKNLKDDKKKDKKDKKGSHRHKSSKDRRDRGRSRERKRDKGKKRSRSKSREKSKEKRSRSKSREKSKEKRSRSKSREKSKEKRSRSSSKDNRPKEIKVEKKTVKIEEPEIIPPEETPVERSLTPPPPPTVKVKEDDLSDREPTSTVTIKTPPYAEEKPPLWSGVLTMSEVTKLYTSAYEVSGSGEGLGKEFNKTLECVGRIQPDAVWDYVSRMKKTGTKDIIVIRFECDGEGEKSNYLALYSYLSTRNRMAVIGNNNNKIIKDFYILPLAAHNPIPQILLPLDGPGFDDYRPHLLLGIIIKNKKNISIYPNPQKRKHKVSLTFNKKAKTDRSYTPPLPTDGGTTPPLTSLNKRISVRGLTPPLTTDDDNEPYSPGGDDPYSPGDDDLDTEAANPEITKNLEDLNRMIEEKKQKIESIASGAAIIPGINNLPLPFSRTETNAEEEAYSPSSTLSPPRQQSQPGESIPFFDSNALPDIKLPSNLQEILASIKGGPSVSLDSKRKTSSRSSDEDDYDDDEDEDDRSEKSEPTPEKTNRDPRQRQIQEKSASKISLSQLTDADLIRKAAEMEEMKKKAFQDAQQAPPFFPIMGNPMPFPNAGMPFMKPPPMPMIPPPPIHMPPINEFQQRPPPVQPPHSDFQGRPHVNKDFKDRRNNWDRRGQRSGPSNRHRGFRGGFDRGRGSQFRGRFQRSGSFRGHRGGKYDGVQNEWDEEIRNFEQRKARESDRERRKRRTRSRSASPRRRRRRNSNSS